jgi:PAS domain S-box-containing protein
MDVKGPREDSEKGSKAFESFAGGLETIEEKMAVVTDMARIAYWEHDIVNSVLRFNDPFYKLFKTSAEQVGGYYLSTDEFFERFIPPDDQSFIKAEMHRHSAIKAPRYSHEMEHRILYGDGKTGHVKVRLFLFQDREGRPFKSYGVVQDISEQKKSEEALRFTQFAIDRTIDQAFWTTAGGRLIYVNDAACRSLGYSREELLALTMMDIVPSSSRESFARHWGALNENPSHTFECFHRAKDGRVYPVEIRCNYVLFDGEAYNCAFVTDITRRKQMEQSLRESEGRVRTLLQTIPDLIWLKDEKGVFLNCNSSFEKLLGAGKEEIIGKTDYDFLEAGLADYFRENDRKAIAAGRPTRNEEWVTFFEDGHRALLETIKTPMFDQQGELIGVLGVARDITDRKQNEENLQKEGKKYRTILQTAVDGFWLTDLNGRILEVNDAYCRMSGYREEELLAMFISELDGRLGPGDVQDEIQLVLDQGHDRFETCHRRKDGSLYDVEVSVQHLEIEDGRLVIFLRDITMLKQAEQENERLHSQLLQSHKMESVGRLAGGVAHDFNNMLGVILGHGELALEQVPPDHRLYEALQEIMSAARQSANVTRQLLAFARKQTISPRVLDINKTVSSMLKMLQRLIGEDIDLKWLPGAAVWPVMIDPVQVDQILANLCTNARDAITNVGKITIETVNAEFDEDYCSQHHGFSPGEYVLLAVSDDGAGMDAETLENIFEPFYTTKEMGKGTGLGLATVHGIVCQNNGFMNVYSEPDRGTTFKLYFPRHRVIHGSLQGGGKEKPAEPGHETVLLVEDEQSILKMAKIMLEKLGYRVLAARTVADALRMSTEYDGSIHLLITDVIMPEMNGRELSQKILSVHPELKCLFMSGYTANVIAHHGVLDEGVNFIQKPFSKRELGGKVREALEGTKE